MKRAVPYILLLLALVVSISTIFGDTSYQKLRSLTRVLEQERDKNLQLSDTVRSMRRQVEGLQSDPVMIERAAREELGMARPNERIYLFEKKGEGANQEQAR